MTPKEKAEYLIDIFVRDGYDLVMSEKMSKRCALILVDEMLNSGNLEPQLKQAKYRGKEPYSFELEYWYEVKQEIEKL